MCSAYGIDLALLHKQRQAKENEEKLNELHYEKITLPSEAYFPITPYDIYISAPPFPAPIIIYTPSTHLTYTQVSMYGSIEDYYTLTYTLTRQNFKKFKYKYAIPTDIYKALTLIHTTFPEYKQYRIKESLDRLRTNGYRVHRRPGEPDLVIPYTPYELALVKYLHSFLGEYMLNNSTKTEYSIVTKRIEELYPKLRPYFNKYLSQSSTTSTSTSTI